jgi:putative endonuclease
MPEKHSLGKWGEDTACQFLEMCGYKCLDRRYRRPGGEVDLIFSRDGMVIFVEVKTRGPRCPVPPEVLVTRHQLARLRRMARIWMAEHHDPATRGYRFDVVAIAYGGNEGGSELRHIVGVG